MDSLVGTADGEVEVVCLLSRERRQLDVEVRKVGTGDLLVKLLGKHVHAERELLDLSPERDLREDLVREGAGHDERRVTGRTSV